jgi:hypothetical protein
LKRNELTFCDDKGQQSDSPGSFDGQGQCSLVFGAVTRDAPGHDFTAFRDKLFQGVKIFIVDTQIGISTETAEFPAMKEFFLSSLGFCTSRILHVLSSVINRPYRSSWVLSLCG